MLRDRCDCMCACLHTCEIPSTNEKSAVSASLPTVQSHIPNRNFAITTLTLVTVTFSLIALLSPACSLLNHASATRLSVFRIKKSMMCFDVLHKTQQSMIQHKTHHNTAYNTTYNAESYSIQHNTQRSIIQHTPLHCHILCCWVSV